MSFPNICTSPFLNKYVAKFRLLSRIQRLFETISNYAYICISLGCSTTHFNIVVVVIIYTLSVVSFWLTTCTVHSSSLNSFKTKKRKEWKGGMVNFVFKPFIYAINNIAKEAVSVSYILFLIHDSVKVLSKTYNNVPIGAN